MPKLVAEEGALKELVLSMDEGDQWVIGRDPDACQLLVEDLAASRKHATCRKTSQGIVIENLSSTNPLQINEESLKEPRLLQQGDSVKIGDTLFRYYSDPEAHLIEDQKTETIIPEANQAPFSAKARMNDFPNKEDRNDTIFEEETDQKVELAHVNFDLLETGRWLLKVVSGPNNGAEFSMQTGSSYVIGTDPNACDMVFYDNSVSRQHVRISISQDDKITIEDLKSRNGTRVDGELLTSPRELPFNTLVNVGTTSFVVYDREGEMQTIISPLLPSIVKVLQKEEDAKAAGAAAAGGAGGGKGGNGEDEEALSGAEAGARPATHAVGALILTAILIGLFAIVGLAVQSLFVPTTPVMIDKPIDIDHYLSDSLKTFPGVKSLFNKTSGRLLLVGHVLTPTDKNQLLYNLQGAKFIKDIDDSGVVIDEFVWTEANQVLSRNPQWKGVTVHAPEAGHFVVSGYLQSRDQASGVWDYLTRNFPYIDLLENKIVVEEHILQNVANVLHNQGINTVTPQIANGELTLTGAIPADKKQIFAENLAQFREVPGVRAIRNLVTEQARGSDVVNISDRYLVSGVSRASAGQLNVVINGRILTEGDILDGMTITSIQPTAVMLKKDDVVYKIDIAR